MDQNEDFFDLFSDCSITKLQYRFQTSRYPSVLAFYVCSGKEIGEDADEDSVA